MPTTAEEAREELGRLAAGSSPDIRPLLEKLRAASDTSAIPPNLLEDVVHLARALTADPPDDVVATLADEKATEAYFDQRGTTVGNLQAASRIFNITFQMVSSAAGSTVEALKMPVVLVTLDTGLFSELENGTAFEHSPAPLRAHFRRLAQLLAKEGCGDLAARYGPTSRDWRPFGTAEPSVVELVARIFDVVNESRELPPPLAPWILDLHEVKDDRLKLRRLRKGCIVVLDTVALRHPKVQEQFHLAMLDVYPSAVLAVAPVSKAFEVGRKLSVVVRLSGEELEFARRLVDLNEDMDVCKESANINEVEHWLATRVRQFAGRGAPRLAGQQAATAG